MTSRDSLDTKHFNIVGSGLSGALLAIVLARRGYRVDLYERRSDPRRLDLDSGRSINLALAARGISALQEAEAFTAVRSSLIPMRGRMLHEPRQPAQLMAYGAREHEVIWSVSRAALNLALIEAAATYPQIEFHFDTACVAIDTTANTLLLQTATNGDERCVPLTPTIATDGAGSVVRHSLQAAGLLRAQEELLEHDYKELTIPARDGQPALDPHALHIWPRGGFMLIALPNPDQSFTATLFLAKQGSPGFDSLRDPTAVRQFFSDYFPDTTGLMPDQVSEFLSHSQGILGTVQCDRWHVDGKVLLLGDAAHAIVPFHGQGANCAFEDCSVLGRLLDSHTGVELDTAQLFGAFEASRRDNARSIAQMALENYTEMRDTVRDPRFQRLKALSLELERRHPGQFIPRYSMVMFHADISYAEAQRRGATQTAILDRVDRAAAGGAPNYALAAQLIARELTPLRSSN